MTEKNSDYYQQQFDQAYRPGVGIVLFNPDGMILVAERVDSRGSWQLPQGGIDEGEDIVEATFREMEEEIGTRNAEIIGMLDEWIYYDFPPHVMRNFNSQYRGQRQKWVALRFTGNDSDIRLDTHETPEFQNWKWVSMDEVLTLIVPFKKKAYEQVFESFKNLV